MEQIEQFVELIRPIKDKVLAITPGNHERRSYKTEGIDITEIAARELGIHSKYSKTAALLFIRFGEGNKKESNGSGRYRKLCYTVYLTHGAGGGRKEGAKAIRLADMASIVDADIYIHSHTHLPMVMKENYYRVDIQNSNAMPVTKLFVNTAATLNYGGYGEMYEFKPSSKDNPIIYLNGRKKEFTARL
jgi:DNA repair exonuclease SbcCD nuclease subunit